MATDTIAPEEVTAAGELRDPAQAPLQLDIPAQDAPAGQQTAGVVTDAIKAGLDMLGPQVDNAVPAPTQAAPAPTQALPTPNPSEPALPGATVRDDLALDEKAAVQSVDGAVLVRQATDAEMMMFEAAIPRMDGKPGATGLNYFPMNLDQMTDAFNGNLAAFQAKIVGANSVAIEQMKRGKMTIEEIGHAAEKIGLKDMAMRLLNKQPGEVFNAEEMYKALVTQASALLTAKSAYDDMIADPTDASALNFLLAINLQGALTTSLVGAKTEAARTMAVLTNFSKIMQANQMPSADDVTGMFGQMPNIEGMSPEDIIANMGGIETIMARGQAYMMLRPDQQSQVASGFSKWFNKGVDVFMESFMNGLLSGIPTHMVNVLGNAGFQIYSIPERFIAGAIGAARTSIPGSNQSRVYMTEALAIPAGMMMSFNASMRAAAKAFVTEDPSDLVSKIDYRTRKAITAENLELDPDAAVGWAVDMLGKITRIAGRFLLTEDEFFKGSARGVAQYTTAVRRALDLKAQGADEATVRASIVQAIQNPDEALLTTMKDYGQLMTFQKDLEGVLGQLQGFFSHPAMKIFVPFYKTPTNIMREVMSRNVLSAPLLPSFWKAIKAGGPEADMAMSKMALGSTIMAAFAGYSYGAEGDDVLMTGHGPSDPKAREAWLRHHQPYSFSVKMEDGTRKSITYSRFDPLSGVLAVAADFAWYARHSDDEDMISSLAAAAAMSNYNYVGQLPMLQGMFSIAEIFGSEYEGGEAKFKRLQELLGKQVGSAAITALPLPTGSFTASIERYFDPTKKNTLPTDTNVAPLVRGFYEALQKARSRSPFFSKDMEPALDRWGTPRMEGDGQVWELASPIKIRIDEYQMVDDEMSDLNLGLSRVPKSIEGIKLTGKQQNMLVLLANNPPDGGNLLEDLKEMILSPEYQDLLPGFRITELRAIDSVYWSNARKYLLEMDPDLRARVDERNGIRDVTGKAPIQ